MNRVTMAGVVFIATMLAFAGGAFAGSGLPNPPAGGLSQKAGQGAGVHGEHHPLMRKAIDQLGRVKELLNQDTDRDSEGHRAQALVLIDQAIEQLQEGIADGKHRPR
jgi:hypothetical protein